MIKSVKYSEFQLRQYHCIGTNQTNAISRITISKCAIPKFYFHFTPNNAISIWSLGVNKMNGTGLVEL